MPGIIFDFDFALSQFYQRVAESTESEDVRELFLNLVHSVKEQKKNLAFDASGLKQLQSKRVCRAQTA